MYIIGQTSGAFGRRHWMSTTQHLSITLDLFGANWGMGGRGKGCSPRLGYEEFGFTGYCGCIVEKCGYDQHMFSIFRKIVNHGSKF